MYNKTIKLQDFTRLPVHEIVAADKGLPDILVTTPHKGMVNIKLTSESHGFFSGRIQIAKHADDIVSELQNLEQEELGQIL
jgi:hypothetical protein